MTLELSQLRFSRIIFQYSHRPISALNLAPDPRLAPTTLNATQPFIMLGQDYQAVQVEIESPETSEFRVCVSYSEKRTDSGYLLQYISIENDRLSSALIPEETV